MQKIVPWKHKVQYYETDQMKIVHHSNYIRWFEEARVSMLEQIGAGYDTFEKEGIISPVLTVESEYRQMVRFGETVEIRVKVEAFNGVRLILAYEVVRESDGILCCTGRTSHCFLDSQGKPLSLKRSKPEFYLAISSLPVEE
ncbi:acyl-CoA thioesterase [Ruminococcus sp. 5_1_39BFAA]|uniref:acyl-CoA thioesterase n=1 Tax=Ruminococcus sp. 5_1_39BFAA TaxID=457412 RepID=UPI0035679FD5